MMFNKRLVWEIIGIVLLGCFIGLVNNYYSVKPFKIIPLGDKELQIPDSVLFSSKDPGQEYQNKSISYNQIFRFSSNQGVVIVDARRPEAYSAGHIGNSVNIFPEWEEAEYVQKILTLPRNKPIIVYCDGGTCDLSHELARDLIMSFNFKKVFIYTGGWEEWSKRQKNSGNK
jgi:rhodanese-related sulfurtransferase